MMVDNRTSLLRKVAPWWKANNYNLDKLKAMDEVQLCAIYYRAKRCNFAVKKKVKKVKPQYEQLTLFSK